MAKKEKEVIDYYYRVNHRDDHMFNLETVTVVNGVVDPAQTHNSEYTFLPIVLDLLRRKIRYTLVKAIDPVAYTQEAAND